MVELPSGTVTLLFTDIEGSTRLLKQLGDRYGDVLSEHRRILRDAVEARGGREVDTTPQEGGLRFRGCNQEAAALDSRLEDAQKHRKTSVRTKESSSRSSSMHH